ncbi:VanZ family protein [Streptococcus sp. E17BB]|uniref:VanZ family protein n=1 Tax=Streptococcus sp. E17BB TaxID=3278714 RepID=UPI00359DD0E5
MTCRRLIQGATLAYAIFVAVICFMPQPNFGLEETPGIQHFGRVVVLLRPFNTLWGWQAINSFRQLVWVICQNVMNIFLLYPLVLGLLHLFPSLRSMARAIKLAFYLSLSIELTQIVLDLLIDANRVFELDDLWTNTLGGLLAYLTYRHVTSKHINID